MIKFRAWDKVNKCWNDDIVISGDGVALEMTGFMGVDLEVEQAYDIEIIQSTGLKDKNNTGVELFEGDVVYIAGAGNSKVVICPLYGVSFDNGGTINEPYIDALMESDIGEKLGTIHANPELMEQS